MNLGPNKRIVLGVTAVVIVFLSIFTFKLSATPAPRVRGISSSSSSSETGTTRQLPAPPSSSEPEPIEKFGKPSVNLLAVGIDATQKLTDVIMLLRINLGEGTVSVLQIPRDSYVGGDVPTGKINAIYGSKGGNIQKLKQAVEDITALNIDYYATITLEGLRKVIDNIGGVEVDIPIRIDYLPGKVIEPGLQHIDGEKAEWIVRYRAGYASGDLGRIHTQKLLIEAIISKMKAQGLMSSFAAISQNYGYITTDLPITKLISLANEAFGIDVNNIQFYTAPGYGLMHNGYAVYALDAERLSEILNTSFRKAGEAVTSGYLRIPAVYPDQ